MKILGVVGGIGSGKSWVAAKLAARFGAPVVNADRLGHRLWDSPTIVDAAVERWGEQVRKPDGAVDRRKIAKIVFAGTAEANAELEWLNTLMRPSLERLFLETIDRLEGERVERAVLDAALLFEAGWDRYCDAVVFVDAAPERRFLRWKYREESCGYHRNEVDSRAEWERREKTQWDLDRKRSLADFVFANDREQWLDLPAMDALWNRFVTEKSSKK